jgi:hypothetical protein
MRNLSAKRTAPTTQALIVCGHCLGKARMPIVFSCSRADGRSGVRTLRGIETSWELLSCPNCEMLQLRAGHTSPDDVDPFRWEVVYPDTRKLPRGLPTEVARAYEAALIMRGVDQAAYAVLLGTVLEIVCQHEDAWGQSLLYRLRDLASRSLIPATLADTAHGLRAFRTSMAMARATDLGADDVPLLEPLCEAVLTYVYVGPALMAAAARSTPARS